jgi:hypothetical protein
MRVELEDPKVHSILFAAGHFWRMNVNEIEEEIELVRTRGHWKSGRIVLEEFFRLHPELGTRYTENVYNNFVRVHGPRLAALDVMRKAGLRSPALFDVTKFDGIAFDVITKAKVMVWPRQPGSTEFSNDGPRKFEGGGNHDQHL